MQGYDAAQILAAGLKAVNGDLTKRDELRRRCARPSSTARAASSRISPAGNPVQDMYLREVKGNNNEFREHRGQGAGRPGDRLLDVTQ